MKWILFLLILCSCGPVAKLKRAEKLIKKAEELGAVWHVDSVQVEVPVFVPETRVDSIFVQKPGDSVVIEKERLKVIIKRLKGDTIKVEAECKADTIKVKVTKTVTKTIQAKDGIKWWWLIVVFVGGAIVGKFVIRLLI